VAGFSVRLVGLDKVRKLAERDKGLRPIIERAVFMEANTVLNESKKIVPVAFGALKGSGRVEPPQSTGARTVVEVTYGGAAAPYALIVHEVPPGSGGRWGTGMKHKAGKTYKYLEIPANAHRDKFTRNVKERIAAYLRKQR
jgi:hypothetical protein